MRVFSDICIIGAGVGGLYCANELASAAACRGLSIRVFDLRPEVGGRIRSSTADGRQPVELGAERYSPALHPHVLNILQRHDRKSQPYPFAGQTAESPTQQAVRAALAELSSMPAELRQEPFFATLGRRLGRETATSLIRSLGYDALFLPTISAAMADGIVGSHPETQALTGNGANPWFCVEGGMQGLLKEMQARAEAGGAAFSLHHHLQSVTATPDGYSLTLLDEQERVVTYETRHLILALPPTAMRLLNLDFPQAWSTASYGSLPLFKGFLFYSQPWWLAHGLSDQVRIVDNPLRKVYFRSDRYVFFYNDSESASYWRSCLADGEQWYLTTVRRYLAEALGLDEAAIPEPSHQLHHFWRHGVEFHQSGTDRHPLALRHATNGIIACSDAYTAHCGWMEGSLQSAGEACRLLLARLSS
ncbi:flavin monoamine oxidase family protein [Paludibacterium purpuratum]|nr:FAD-dependent oxidoreductase [Paludibacterium purpuratum]